MAMPVRMKSKLIRYCALCGVIYLAVLACWGLVWGLGPVRTALAEMKTVTDAYERQVAFSWLGSLISGTAGAAACLFLLAAFLLEGPMLGAHLKRTGTEVRLGWAGRFILLAVVGAAVLGNNLTLRLYVHPILFFAAVLLLFLLRLGQWSRLLAAEGPGGRYDPI